MKKESSMQKLFAYAGNYKYLTIASWILSAVSALIALLPFYYIWRIMREVVMAAPDYQCGSGCSHSGELCKMGNRTHLRSYIRNLRRNSGCLCAGFSGLRQGF